MGRTREVARRAVSRVLPGLGATTGVDTSEPVIGLTFDDGPHPSATAALLDVLAGHGARATFFLVGHDAERHPELVRRIAAAGHVVASRGWDHCSMVLDRPDGVMSTSRWHRAEIRQGLHALGDEATALYHPAHGHQDWLTSVDAMLERTPVIAWTHDAGDWIDGPGPKVGRVLGQVAAGDIVAFHDGLGDPGALATHRCIDVGAVDQFLRGLPDGHRCVTIPELLTLGPARHRYAFPRAQWDDRPVDHAPTLALRSVSA